MRWWTNWYRNRGSHWFFSLCLVAAVAVGVSRAALAQETLDHAMDLFNNGEMEEACGAFQRLDKGKPGDPQIQGYLKASCAQVPQLRKTEEELFNQGVQLFKQGQLDDARQRFKQTADLKGLKNWRYHDEALRYMKQIDARQGEDKMFQEGVRLFSESKYVEARDRFNPLAQGGGPHAAEARNYLGRIDEAIQKQNADEQIRRTFGEGVSYYKAKKYAEAYIAFDNVVKKGGPKAAEAQAYLTKTDEMLRKQKEEEARKNEPPKPPPPGPHPTPSPVSDQSLRAGLRAYFSGDLEAADRDLSDYLNQNGPKQALAYFFRGATHSSRFFLSGEKESSEKELAVKDFQSAKAHDQAFQPPNQYVPPKILALYSQAAGAPSP
jgi:hypothetical protein